MTQKVTKRQQAVLDCIEACIREKGYGPTVREVCQSLGLSSPSTVHVHLKALEDKGFIKRDPLKSRSIALTYPIEEVPSPVTAFAAAYQQARQCALGGQRGCRLPYSRRGEHHRYHHAAHGHRRRRPLLHALGARASP